MLCTKLKVSGELLAVEAAISRTVKWEYQASIQLETRYEYVQIRPDSFNFI